MLSVGREVLAEPNTSSSSDDLMKKLTSFIEDWSGLQLSWQNWYDELHAQKEQSQQLSDQLKKFESAMQELDPALSRLFPATVAVKNLDKEMNKLQVSLKMVNMWCCVGGRGMTRASWSPSVGNGPA